MISWFLFALLSSLPQDDIAPLPGSAPLPERLEEPFSRRDVSSSVTESASKALSPWLHEVSEYFEGLVHGEHNEQGVEFLDGVVSNDLRPAQLEELTLVGAAVWRGKPEADAPETSFGENLERLAASFAGGEFHSHFKTIGVRLVEDDPRGRTEFDLRFETSGHGPDGPVQQVSYWTVEFETVEPTRALRVRGTQFEEVRVPRETYFEDVTKSVFENSPDFERQLLPSLDHWSARIDSSLGMSLLGHEGLALGDVDGDGREDLYVSQPGGLPNRLFLHQADHTLRDVSHSSGVDFLDLAHSALIIDLDGDGDRDLAAVVSEELLLLSNQGGWDTEAGGRFELVRALPALSVFSLSAADFDDDGDLDLFGCAYSLPYWEHSVPLPYHDANNGRANCLYRNDGEWKFTDVTRDVGLDHNNSRYSFAAAWEDYDRDGDQDLYVANDFGRNNLYRNDEGRFTDVAAEAGVEDISAGMGVDWADVDGDGWMDLLVTNMFSSAGGRIAYQRNFHPDAGEETRSQYRRHARGNSLFRNLGDGTFEDVTTASGMGMGRWAWGAIFGDWNGDGNADIFVPNGFVTNDDKDDL